MTFMKTLKQKRSGGVEEWRGRLRRWLMLSHCLLVSLSPLLSPAQTVGQWELRKRGATGMTSYGITAEDGKAIGFTAGVPGMIAVGGTLTSGTTPISGITNGYALYNNAGVLGGLNLAALYQPLDSDLTSIAALTTTTYGRSLLTTASDDALSLALTSVYNVKTYGAVGDAIEVANATTTNTSTTVTQSPTWDTSGGTTATTTNGSADVTLSPAVVISRYRVGMAVTGTGIPATTFISAIDDNTATITLSNAATASGTPTLSIYVHPFTSAHVGKVIYGIRDSTKAKVLDTTISAVAADGLSCTTTAAATGTASDVGLVWGTDDSAAFATWNAALVAAKVGTAYIPSGRYITKHRIMRVNIAHAQDGIKLKGDGSDSTIIYVHPDWTSGTEVGGGDFIYNASGIEGLQAKTLGYHYTVGNSDKFIVNGNAVRDVKIDGHYGWTLVFYSSGAYNSYTDCVVSGDGAYPFYILNQATLRNCRTSGSNTSSVYMNGASYSNVSDCSFAQSTGSGMEINGSVKVNVVNSLIYGNSNTYGVPLTGNSEVRLTNCRLLSGGLSVASGSTATVTNSEFVDNGTAYGILASGTVNVGSGTTYTTSSGSGLAYAGSAVVTPITLGGTGAATLNDLITLGTHTSGNYVATVTGTANEITSSVETGEGAATVLSLPATIDLGGKTSFEIPNAAAPTVDAFGEIAGDDNLWAASRGAPVFFDGTASTALVNVLVSDAPSNGQVPTWNTGGTITWETPSSGGVAVGDSPTWTGVHTFAKGTNSATPVNAVGLVNSTDAILGTQSASPSLVLQGEGWRSGNSTNHTVAFDQFVLPVQGSSADPTGTWKLRASIDGGAYVDKLAINSDTGATITTTASSGSVASFTSAYGTGSLTIGGGGAGTWSAVWNATSLTVNNTTGYIGIGTTTDTILYRDGAAGIFAQRNGTNAQVFRLYDTYTSATDYHRMAVATARASVTATAGATVTATALIPDGAVVVGVTTKVTTGLGTGSGTTGYQVGDGTDADRWGSITGTAAGTSSDNTNWTAGGIECFTSATNVVLTATGGNFDGTGVIYVVVHYLTGQSD